MSMRMYAVYTKRWSENSIGEQSEGPWTLHSTHKDRTVAKLVARNEAYTGTVNGVWTKVVECGKEGEPQP